MRREGGEGRREGKGGQGREEGRREGRRSGRKGERNEIQLWLVSRNVALHRKLMYCGLRDIPSQIPSQLFSRVRSLVMRLSSHSSVQANVPSHRFFPSQKAM